ncbi:uncharacterized protein LOC120011213 [Tripterygium wilfordii]|uniref:uncharacterized protein LOC120011213 n=1 Tax=Tripterygium wilfordii TaxID=458696 RepID=UPI0018F817FE|nr:uncharacterized protein LOC120011213 [Tripterygium wilfordii]
MTERVGKLIGNSIGVCMDIDTQKDGLGWGPYLRIRVLIPLYNPLPRGKKLDLPDRSVTVGFLYEFLPKFCYKCGRITHEKGGCPVVSSSRLHEDEDQWEYGNWMRAPSFTRRQPSMNSNENRRRSFTSGDRWKPEEGNQKSQSADGSQSREPDKVGTAFEELSSANHGVEKVAIFEECANKSVTANQGLITPNVDPFLIVDYEEGPLGAHGNKSMDVMDKSTKANEKVVQAMISRDVHTTEKKCQKTSWKRRARAIGENTAQTMEIVDRGLGNRSTIRELGHLVRIKSPRICFLIETKLHSSKIDFVRNKLHFKHGLAVDSIGSRGGLMLLWKEEVDISVLSYSTWHIHVEIKEGSDVFSWNLTCFYGHPEASQRKFSWDLLRFLSGSIQSPWLCVGDFNAISNGGEKVGGSVRCGSLMDDFNNALADCNLLDLGFRGNKYTWSNRRGCPESFIKERLDRSLASVDWLVKWGSYQVEYINTISSDHSCQYVCWDDRVLRRGAHTKRFRYEPNLGAKEMCKQLVRQQWVRRPGREGGHMALKSLQNNLQQCGPKIQQWMVKERQKYSNTEKVLKRRLDSLVANEDAGKQEEISVVRQQLNELREQEEEVLKNQSKQHWLQAGDQNTSFFHTSMKIRQNLKRIDQIVDEDGGLRSTEVGVVEAFHEYFSNLFSAGNEVQDYSFLDPVTKVVDTEMNEDLCRMVTREDVWDAKLCLNFFSSGVMESDVNLTHIALIPKTKEALKVTEFRPISLCNVSYKIISKILANRLGLILHKCVRGNQSAFIRDRLITDNVIVAYEALHSMSLLARSRTSYMAVKLDMSKAYDRVDWHFVQEIMVRLGFSDEWQKWIMQCISSVTYRVLVNGSTTDLIILTRGIRQGDPLSPLLFVLCTEALSSNLNAAHAAHTFRGFPFGRGRLRVSHLVFADDSLIFCRVKDEDWECIFSILTEYGRVSGQMINYSKTSIFFSRFASPLQKARMISMIGAVEAKNYDRYLGLPAIVGRSRKSAFLYILDKMRKKVMGWSHRNLSKCWRIIINPTSLSSRVLKAKYFPNTDFLKVEKKRNASYLWTSFLNVRYLIEDGLRWRIGNGATVHIWGNNWLPEPVIYNVNIEELGIPRTAMVDTLIDWSIGWWNVRLLEELFEVETASMILKQPIGSPYVSDSVYWNGTSNGSYTVRSGYYRAIEIRERPSASCSEPIANPCTTVWTHIWSLNVPPSTRVFLWSAVHEILPTNSLLHHRHILDNPVCPLCKQNNETTLHALWECPSARDVFCVSLRKLQKLNSYFNGSFGQFWNDIRCVLSIQEVSTLAITMRMIWLRRNKFVHEGNFMHPTQIALRGIHTADDFIKAKQSLEVPQPGGISENNQRILEFWRGPPRNVVKSNWDAAIHTQTNRTGMGIVFRDEYGDVLASCALVRSTILDPTLAEALACLQAVKLSSELGFTELIFEGDSAVIVNAINGSVPTRAVWSKVIEEIKRLLGYFMSWKVVFVRRTANLAAHSMAKHALLVQDMQVWIEEVPSSVVNIVYAEKLAWERDMQGGGELV